MEARFLFIPTDIKGGGDRVRKMRQERFLEYGKNELLVYVRVAAAIGDTHRLFPDVLAAADPQMFWSAGFRLCWWLLSPLHWLLTATAPSWVWYRTLGPDSERRLVR